MSDLRTLLRLTETETNTRGENDNNTDAVAALLAKPPKERPAQTLPTQNRGAGLRHNFADESWVPDADGEDELDDEMVFDADLEGGEDMPGLSREEKARELKRYTDILSKSEMGRELLKMAEEMGIKFDLQPSDQVYGYYDPSANLVALSPRGDDGRVVATLAHELRHAWQFKNGFATRLDRDPRDNLWMMRVMEADAEAASIRVAVELNFQGFAPALSSHLQSEYGDQVEAFMHEVKKDRGALTDGRGQRAVFDQWFARNWRRGAYDNHSMDYLEHHLYAVNDHGKAGFKQTTAKWIAGIGKQFDGTNYLEGTGDIALDDDYYRGGLDEKTTQRLAHIERRLAKTRKKPAAEQARKVVNARLPGRPARSEYDEEPAPDDAPGVKAPRPAPIPPSRGLAP